MKDTKKNLKIQIRRELSKIESQVKLSFSNLERESERFAYLKKRQTECINMLNKLNQL